MMGKYDDKYSGNMDEPTDVFNSLMLRDIANELAEANRLKKLEIRVILHDSDVGLELRKQFLGELEDQA